MGRSGLRFFPAILLFLGITVLVGFFLWTTNTHTAMPEALEGLVSDSDILVQRDPWLVFRPNGGNPSTGLILYPGGLVDHSAYAPAGREIAMGGYLVVIPPMPLNLAVFGYNFATEIMAAYPEISRWAIGGHSLGGSMEALYVDQNPGEISGLILWASYPAKMNDLSREVIAVSSIYGTVDGLATLDEVLESRSKLPVNTVWVPIDGGNHAQFGWYGSQDGDNPATIDRDQQQSQIVTATLALLSQLGE